MLRSSPTPPEASASLRERVLDLVWSLWAELGVPGWARRHQDWAIDPEPLILFTAGLGESDARLRDECIRWCVRNSRSISVARLRNLLKPATPSLRDHWGRFAATVNAHGAVGWPGATEPLPLRPSAREGLDDFRRAAAVSLRLRAIFGVSARSEILLYFIAHQRTHATAADLAEIVSYSKRNVEKELEALRKGGMLGVERRRNRLEHFVVQPESLLLFAAPRPGFFPRWEAIFAVLGALMEYEERVQAMAPAVAAVEARRLARELADAIRDGNLPTLSLEAPGSSVATALPRWGSRITDALARGDAPALGWAIAPSAPQDWRTSSAEGRRGIVAPLLATATDLAVWADTRAAQERMAELLRRLILATADGLRRLDMAAGEGVQHGGYDGVVLTGGPTPFVPAGQSVWEIGVSSDIKGKADSDYAKRSANPLGVDSAETTFVFVTPRRWASKRIWEKACRQDGPWRDVRVLDADDLETWLGLAPAAHTWFSAVLGKSWSSVQDPRSYWADWREATDPPLSAEVVLAGRAQTAYDLRAAIEAASGVVRVQGESADEALAFIAAAIAGMEHAEALLARALVIDDMAGWDWAVNSTSPLILIPRFSGPNTPRAIRHGHRVLLPVGREEGAPDDIVLPRPDRDALLAALLRLGVAEGTANDLAKRGRTSLTALRRSLANGGELARPAWAHRGEGVALLPALLAGAWNERMAGDREAVAALAERPYHDVERSLTRWAQAADPPVRKVGTSWFLVSKDDAWGLLSAHLTPTDLALFRTALLRALVADPPPEQRWRVSVDSYKHALSEYLREGLVDTLAIMGARSGDTDFLTGHTGQWHADDITEDLLKRANASWSATSWAALSGVLPLLAEAAPEPFLSAVAGALSGEPAPLVALFTDAGPTTTLVGASPRAGLLQALESLGWSTEYMGLVAHHLATLSRLDPGGQLSNGPFSSLRSIFLIWDPQTTAPLADRLRVLDNLRGQTPDVAWRLMLAILPKPYDIVSPSYAPRWRDWKRSRDQRVYFKEYHQAIEAVNTRLLEDVGLDAARWSDLLGIAGDLPHDQLVGALENTAHDAFLDEGRMMVWGALRSAISKHRRFTNAPRALPADMVDRLERVYEQLTPHDPIQRVAWLFSAQPALLEGGPVEWSSYLQAVHNAQAQAIRTVRERGGLAGLLSLAHHVKRPEVIGSLSALTATAEAEDEWPPILKLLDTPDVAERGLAWSYAAQRFTMSGWPWARSVLENAAPWWSPEKRAAFLRALPFESETWNWAERLGDDTERAYWLGVQDPWIKDPADVERAARRLMRYDRPAYAVSLLGRLLHGGAPEADPEVIAGALEQLVGQGNTWGESARDVTILLDYLTTCEAFDAARLAHLEWICLPLVRHEERPAGVLSRELAHNPAFFMDVLCTAFRAQDEEPGEATDEQRARALLGYQLLNSWRRPPGVRDDGTVDEEALGAWIKEARTLATARQRVAIADQQIGRVLRYLPDDPDGLWPHRAVRETIERTASRDLETGLELELRNSRGMTSRGLSEGGAQERALETHYRDNASHLNAHWPRTAALVRRIAGSFAEEARWQDEQAAIGEERWR